MFVIVNIGNLYLTNSTRRIIAEHLNQHADFKAPVAQVRSPFIASTHRKLACQRISEAIEEIQIFMMLGQDNALTLLPAALPIAGNPALDRYCQPSRKTLC